MTALFYWTGAAVWAGWVTVALWFAVRLTRILRADAKSSREKHADVDALAAAAKLQARRARVESNGSYDDEHALYPGAA